MNVAVAHPAIQSEALVVMMTPDELAALEARARELDLTSAELVRRATANYIPDVNEAMLDRFLTEFEGNNAAMRATINGSLERIDATLAEIEALRASR